MQPYLSKLLHRCAAKTQSTALLLLAADAALLPSAADIVNGATGPTRISFTHFRSRRRLEIIVHSRAAFPGVSPLSHKYRALPQTRRSRSSTGKLFRAASDPLQLIFRYASVHHCTFYAIHPPIPRSSSKSTPLPSALFARLTNLPSCILRIPPGRYHHSILRSGRFSIFMVGKLKVNRWTIDVTNSIESLGLRLMSSMGA